MKTCSEYINEARQNYIFGGTDNRNVDVELVWANVKQGDKIYVWRAREERKVSLERIIGIENRQTKKKIDAENCLCFIDNDELDSDVHCIVDKYSFCIATNFYALQDAVKKLFDKDITEENIREFGVREARQNYIFGGTDDRNTNISSAELLSSLKAGDDIYFYREGAAAPSKNTFFKFKKDHEKHKGISIEVKNATRKFPVYMYSVCETMKELNVSTIYSKSTIVGFMRIISTDEKEFLDEVNKFSGKKYTSADIVDSTTEIFF